MCSMREIQELKEENQIEKKDATSQHFNTGQIILSPEWIVV